MGPDKAQETNQEDLAQRGLCEQLAGDHRRLPMLLSQAEWRVQQKLFPGAERCFAEFCSCLERHLAEEDQVACTLLDRGGEGSGPRAANAGADRETLRRMLFAAGEAIHARNCEWFASSASDLREAFAAHANAEEKKLFPLVEELSSRAGAFEPGLSDRQSR
jgi:hypothetical protein